MFDCIHFLITPCPCICFSFAHIYRVCNICGVSSLPAPFPGLRVSYRLNTLPKQLLLDCDSISSDAIVVAGS